MKTTKSFLISVLIGSASLMLGQTTFTVRVNSSLDDHEERISGAVPQTGTLGDMDSGSSDLELGNETATSDPQLVGVRFTSVTIPPMATIMSAYIQFAVDATAKNTDPCVLNISSENNANPATFSDNPFSLSSRSLTPGSVTWNVSGSTWSVVGSAGTDQRTADIKSLIQPLVFKTGWASGNAMAFFIKGSGTREVESFDGDPALAPQLVITYSLAVTGVNEIEKSSSVTVYPNPFKNSFHVNVDLATSSDLVISVYDLMGKVMEERTFEKASAGTFQYTSGSDLQPGVYFVKVKANKKQQVFKIISE
ncbi:hypothetical protein CNR22_01435 [Sphingobacteriaceae bacterium]|nr:hypothetical protein CNR22_01435 [Sphingobacteriaceae bacterium]